MRLMALAISAALSGPLAASADEAPAPPVKKLTPQMREVERDQDYFDGIDCRRLSEVTPRSEREAGHLKRRKRSCLATYKAFLPR